MKAHKWTKELPVVEGWYWHRIGGAPVVVYWDDRVCIITPNPDSEWFGPFYPPK